MKIRWNVPGRGLSALAMVVAFTALTLAVPGAHAASAPSSSGGYVGVLLQDLNDDLRDSYNFKGSGVLISDVTDGSPADKAGLRRGDIVTSYRGRPVSSSADLTARVREDKENDRAAFTVWRNGQPMTVTVTLGSRDDMPAPQAYDRDDNDNDNDNDNDHRNDNHSRQHTYRYSFPNMQGFNNGFDMMGAGPRLGVEIQDLDGDLGSYFNRPNGQGALVTRVLDDTPAKSAGLHAGDVIIELDGKTIGDTDDLRSNLADRSAGPMRITVLRHGTRQTLTANLEERRGAMSAMPRSWIMSRDGHTTTPKPMSDREREDLRRQMDDLRRQMDDLRQQMNKMDDGSGGKD